MTRTFRRNRSLTHTMQLPKSLVLAAQYELARENDVKQRQLKARQIQRKAAKALKGV